MRLVECARERGLRVGGALTPALMEDGAKVGIQAIGLRSGETRLLARLDRDLGGTRVGPYSFDDRVLEWVKRSCERDLEQPDGVVLLDEIGKLELNRGGGLAPLIPLLNHPREQTRVVLVRDFLLKVMLGRLPDVDPLVVMVDETRREKAWDALAALLFPGKRGEGRRC
jgi:nucleoside-triphosphatase THEP1